INRGQLHRDRSLKVLERDLRTFHRLSPCRATGGVDRAKGRVAGGPRVVGLNVSWRRQVPVRERPLTKRANRWRRGLTSVAGSLFAADQFGLEVAEPGVRGGAS